MFKREIFYISLLKKSALFYTMILLFGMLFFYASVMPCELIAQVRQEPAGNRLPESTIFKNKAMPWQSSASSPSPRARKVSPPSASQHDSFAKRVDLSQFRKLSIFDRGRAKIIDTLAREHLSRIYGKSRWKNPATGKYDDPVFTWLDLLLNKKYYQDKPLIYVQVLALRRLMVQSLLPKNKQERWLHIGRLTPAMMGTSQVHDVFDATASDIKMTKARNQVLIAWATFSQTPADLALFAPATGNAPWTRLADVVGVDTNTNTNTKPKASGDDVNRLAAASPYEVLVAWQALAKSWQRGDGIGVNAALTQLTKKLVQVNGTRGISPWRRELEYFYNRTHKFTIGYVGYFLAMLILLIAIGVQRRKLVVLGTCLLVASFAVHTAGFVIRGLLSNRWPIHNQFESFIALSWFGVLMGMVWMFTKRQWFFGAAAAALGFCTLLFANTVAIPSNEMGQVAGILATSRILYIHVNIVIFSYALIALGFFISLFYLWVYYFLAQNISTPLLAQDEAKAQKKLKRDHRIKAVLRDLDTAQKVVLQLAFWLLGVGILLGAYWADHAWGRFWAWDPKETWALITWIIYLMVIHMRLVAKKPHLTTAWLSVLGFFVMLWTHWGVNLLLAGLHSYA